MQGALSATQDEIAWAMTFNILATAVVTPMTGWLVSRFGTKRVVVWSIGLFTVATLLCGMAQSLEVLVLWRILQGGAGAPVVPLSQSILFDTFPRRQHAMVMSIFGMAVAVAPAFGPVFGGYLAEMHSWRWSFYMLVPIGICATLGMAWTLQSDNRMTKVRFDWTGFIALATALAAVQLVLARGVRLDWFDSTEIVIECLIAAVAFYIFLVHSLGAHAPFVNRPLRRSGPPDGEPDQPPSPAAGRIDPLPNGIRSRRSGLRHSRLRSAPCGTHREAARTGRATRC